MTDFTRPAWLAPGPDCDVVISGRVRIARNLRDQPFPHKLDAPGRREVEQAVVAALAPAMALVRMPEGEEPDPGGKPGARELRGDSSPLQKEPAAPRLIPIPLATLSMERREALAASRLAPVPFAYRQEGIMLTDDLASVSVLINEEDHVRIQVFQPGSLLEPGAAVAARVEQRLGQFLALAWKEPYGYLTSHPANAGGGTRVSALCHLPGLGHRRMLARWLRAASDAGVTMRGVYGEGSRAVGAFFQLSLLGPAGEPAERSAHRLGAIVALLADEERNAREAMGKTYAENRALQCVNLIESASTVSLGQCLRLLSWIRLAAAAGSDQEARWVDRMFAAILLDRWGLAERSDRKRAETLRDWLIGQKGPRI